MRGSFWLILGGWLSAAAALLHITCIFGGPDWYRFLGAGEALAQADARGEWMPAVMTTAIASVLALWAAYAFSGAGRVRRLPLLRTGLVVISTIYLARGLMIFLPLPPGRSDLSPAFMLWSSLIVLVFGIVYALGTWQAWPQLSARRSAATQ